jgi:uncharacterized NAD-dependent epimerase/dehydratase family protein
MGWCCQPTGPDMERLCVLKRDQRLAIYMENAVQDESGKMGFGVLRYSPNPIACVVDSKVAGKSISALTGIKRDCPIVASVQEAVNLGAEVLVLGIAPSGGLIPESWYPVIDSAVRAGLSIVNGLHDLLGPRYAHLRQGQWIWDIRVEPANLSPGTGAAASLANKRVLMIGTDMAVGKMTAGLELQKALQEMGVFTGFVATGQIGVTITGGGVPLDAIRVDFASGAIQREVLARAGNPVVIIEGQGALVHPGSSATLPLLRGSMPTHLVLCHRAGFDHLQKLPVVRIPPLPEYIRLYEDLAKACGSFPMPKTIGVALNTAHLKDQGEAVEACDKIAAELGLPCVDPIRHGMTAIAEALLG